MKRIVTYCAIVLLASGLGCNDQTKRKVWKNTIVLKEGLLNTKNVMGGGRLSTEAILGYLPEEIGKTIYSESLVVANENSGDERLLSEVIQPYYKGANNIIVKVTDFVDAIKYETSNRPVRNMAKTYLKDGYIFTEDIIYDNRYISQSELEVSNERFTINIIANGEERSPAPLPDYLVFVFYNSYLLRLFSLPVTNTTFPLIIRKE